MAKKELELFGEEPKLGVFPDSKHMVLTVPSIDGKVCSQYVSLFLKWLDTTYFEALKEVSDYENIVV